jgi:hypothetical protein
MKTWKRNKGKPMPSALRSLLQSLHYSLREWITTDLVQGHTFELPAMNTTIRTPFMKICNRWYSLTTKVHGKGHQRHLIVTRVYLRLMIARTIERLFPK